MEVETLEHFLYNFDLNNPVTITYKHGDIDNALEKEIFEHCNIKPYVRSTDETGLQQLDPNYIYGLGCGIFTLYRWPEDNEPYYMCQVINIRTIEMKNGNLYKRATMRKLKPYLMLSLIYEDVNGEKFEKRFYKYYKNDFESNSYKNRFVYDDFFNGYSKYDYHNINEYIVFSPNWCDY